MSKSRILSGVVSDGGALADGQLTAEDVGAQPALVSGTTIKTINGTSVLGSGNIQIDGGVTSFNTRTGAVTLSSGDVTTALGFTPVTQTAVDSSISALVDSAPGTLDTLNELAAALGDDPNFATTVSTSIAARLPLSGGTMTGAIGFAGAQTWPTFNQSTTGNAATATALQTARTINGVSFNGSANITVADATKLPLAGGTMTGAIGFAGTQTWPTFNQSTTGTAAGLLNTTWARVTTSSGYIEFGPANTSWAHIYTDRPGFYFNAQLEVNGNRVLNAGNYNSYSPTLTGTGASGTWAISVTGNAVTAGGLAVHAGRNNEVNKLVRTDASGYIQAGWINTDSGDNGTTTPTRIYASQDGYIRYYSVVNFRQVIDVPTRTGGNASGTWAINISGTATTATNLSGGSVNATSGTFTGLITGRPSVGSNVNTNNDSGSLSVRSDALNAASISFHRTSAYAINMGLGTDNVFRIGGWSASSDCFRMDGSGNLTMLANVTAYSDERVKTNWRNLHPDFVERLAEVKHGIYDRTDQTATQVGVSAQSLQKIMKHAVMENADGQLSVAYGNAALVSAVELAKRVVDQETRIQQLESLINTILNKD